MNLEKYFRFSLLFVWPDTNKYVWHNQFSYILLLTLKQINFPIHNHSSEGNVSVLCFFRIFENIHPIPSSFHFLSFSWSSAAGPGMTSGCCVMRGSDYS